VTEFTGVAWHLVTCEYPPQVGGVSDYSLAVATGLAAAGQTVHVWCPRPDASARALRDESPLSSAPGPKPEARSPKPEVHADLDGWRRADLEGLSRMLDRFPSPRRLLVQWVPHGYGYKSMNVGFCLWLRSRHARQDSVDLMVHEPFVPFAARPWHQNVVALVHRVMTTIILSAADRVWVSTPAWGKALAPYAFGRHMDFSWAPVPSSVPTVQNVDGVRALRQKLLGSRRLLVGHFGTYGEPVAALLRPLVIGVADAVPDCSWHFVGTESDRFCRTLVGSTPRLEGRVQATGMLASRDLSLHLQACDVLVQPYPDGVTTRRGSVMAALEHGRPVVTTRGRLTEPMWNDLDAARLVPVDDVEAAVDAVRGLTSDQTERHRLGERAVAAYKERFDVCHTVDALLAS